MAVQVVAFIFGIYLIMDKNKLEATNQAKRLYDDLLRKSQYNRLFRPVGNHTQQLTVFLGMRLSQIIDVVKIFF